MLILPIKSTNKTNSDYIKILIIAIKFLVSIRMLDLTIII